MLKVRAHLGQLSSLLHEAQNISRSMIARGILVEGLYNMTPMICGVLLSVFDSLFNFFCQRTPKSTGTFRA